MGTLKLSDESISKYFGFFKHFDIETKKKLIIELTKSITASPVGKSKIKKLYGAWDDDRSAEEIIADIRNSRTL